MRRICTTYNNFGEKMIAVLERGVTCGLPPLVHVLTSSTFFSLFSLSFSLSALQVFFLLF